MTEFWKRFSRTGYEQQQKKCHVGKSWTLQVFTKPVKNRFHVMTDVVGFVEAVAFPGVEIEFAGHADVIERTQEFPALGRRDSPVILAGINQCWGFHPGRVLDRAAFPDKIQPVVWSEGPVGFCVDLVDPRLTGN